MESFLAHGKSWQVLEGKPKSHRPDTNCISAPRRNLSSRQKISLSTPYHSHWSSWLKRLQNWESEFIFLLSGIPSHQRRMTMLENINYNLVQTIAIISQSLYRYDTYTQDAAGCPSCQEMWRKFKEQRENELSMLLKELKAHIQAGKLSLE
jgi:hypothetical protein